MSSMRGAANAYIISVDEQITACREILNKQQKAKNSRIPKAMSIFVAS